MSSIDRKYNEKRDFIRMQIDSKGRVERQDGQSINVTCVNLSSGGLLLDSPTPLVSDEVIEIHIPSEFEHLAGFDAKAIVIRSTPKGEDNNEVALKIEEILL